MIVGVIGSGSIGPDLAYGFMSALARSPGSKVYLNDIRPEALEAGMARIRGYVKKGVARGKLSPKAAAAIEAGLCPTLDLEALAGCDYVLEAASEDLDVKRAILAQLEGVVGPTCLIGFATSGLPRAWIARDAAHPQRCFVNHPFYPAWRSLPVEVVPSEDEALTRQMMDTLVLLGKVPIETADVACFAADDIFCNYISEAVRLAEQGIATPAQIDRIVDDAVGGGGPFNVMDLTRGNLLVAHCQDLMQAAPSGGAWFAPPALLRTQGDRPWHDRRNPADDRYDEATGALVRDRILAVLLARAYFVVDQGICEPGAFNWLSRMSLGFREGLLDLAERLGADRVRELCTRYQADHPGFEVPSSVSERRLADFHRNLVVTRDDELAIVTICRPEVKNALSGQTVAELGQVFEALANDDSVRGVVLTSFDGAIAGADINELAALKTPEACEAACHRAHPIFEQISALGKPVVAALDGPVLGGGAELAMACHARVVGPGLIFGQPEVNLGIVPGYGGTQRLPRLVGLERALHMLRTGQPAGAKQACEWGWAHGEPQRDFVDAAKRLARLHLAGEVSLSAVDPAPMEVPGELPAVDLGHRSLTIDAILVDIIREGLTQPLPEGLAIEARGFGRCKLTCDFGIGMSNFIQNGPRVPAVFLHE